MDTTTPLEEAISKVGTQQALADALKVRSPSITEWKHRGQVPAGRCIAIERLTGVTRYRLRPDVFGPAPNAKRSRVRA